MKSFRHRRAIERLASLVFLALLLRAFPLMAVDALRKACASEKVRELVEMRMMAKRNWATSLEHAERTGLEKGRQEALLETARRMRQEGMSAETIARVTGLPPEDLDK